MKKPVMVVGGGIAGIQGATDLADMGIPVFLVEKGPSIGGRMAQLDKTFPTNDCSACTLAPKVTSCYNHPLIKTLTLSDLVMVKGNAPDFTAVVRQRPRYVDEGLCKGCDDCVKVCPINVKSEFDMGIGRRSAIYKPYAQAVPNKVSIDKKGTSPCKLNCPANLDAHGYVALTGAGRYGEALKVVRRTTPFAGVLGRVCFHPCEENCTRRYLDQSVSIAGIKRFIADYELSQGIRPSVDVPENISPKEDKIAIVGAGPAGLNCAYQLALKGYKPTVFEALPVVGGMLKVGIPDYRLDKEILKGEIAMVTELGVEIRLNKKLGRDFTIDQLKGEGYKAIFLALGAHKDIKLGIPRENAPGVLSGIDFLRELNLSNAPEIGGKTLVIGGGNVAMDAARSALRLGSDVTVLYRRTKDAMPANPWEIRHAQEEGVKILELETPEEIILEKGKVAGVRCVKNELGEKDHSGRRAPVRVEGSAHLIKADTIIVAAGQRKEEMKPLPPGVFAGGDLVRGPATVVEAIADGNRGAIAIMNYLEGKNDPLTPFLLPETPVEEVDIRRYKEAPRAKMPVISMEKRQSTFIEVETGYDEETARKEGARCVDCSLCCECRLCEQACTSGAICHQQQGATYEIPVSAVILATGYDTAVEIPSELGYRRFADVITGLEYERILSASGPFESHIQRLSDGKAPRRIAFIQCVGSRDGRCNAGYCSAVCCMYAVKEAQITKEHLPAVEEIDIFYMDMRAYGKDFEKYVNMAKEKYGIHFIRGKVGHINQDETTGELILSCLDETGQAEKRRYDMAVLSTGLMPNPENITLARGLGVKTDQYGFIWTHEFNAPRTSREGIFACGGATGPKDIPETVIEASAAAAGAAVIANKTIVDLYRDYEGFFVEEPQVTIRDVSKEPIKIGVFVCHCGVNISDYVDVPQVVAHAKTLPFVYYAEESLYTCSVDAQKSIQDQIKKYGLNRIVVASCTPRTHEPLFQAVLKKSGLNPHLFAMANIRDQCSWVHMDQPVAATEKAKELAAMAVGKVTYARQLSTKKINVNREALVIGGGMAGLSAAAELSAMGYPVQLVEQEGRLGGKALNLSRTAHGIPVEGYVEGIVKKVVDDPGIKVYTNARIGQVEGFVGNFETMIEGPAGNASIAHGVVVVAVGANERKPVEYGYDTFKSAITHLHLDRLLQHPEEVLQGVKDVVMIQCVGSRAEDRPYCSRVCCNQAVRNAITIKETNPDINVTILYREMRTYGTGEVHYTTARQLGVEFVRFNGAASPQVAIKEGRVIVWAADPILGVTLAYPADILSLASAMEPAMEENTRIAHMLKVPLNQDGFFMEAHAKLRPVDFATQGIYLAGLAHSPKGVKEAIVQGKAAASRAAVVLSKDQLETEGTIAAVKDDLCIACGGCEAVCGYKAVFVAEVQRKGKMVRKAVVNDALCKGCGTCAAACRCGAIDVNGFSDGQIISEIGYLLKARR